MLFFEAQLTLQANVAGIGTRCTWVISPGRMHMEYTLVKGRHISFFLFSQISIQRTKLVVQIPKSHNNKFYLEIWSSKCIILMKPGRVYAIHNAFLIKSVPVSIVKYSLEFHLGNFSTGMYTVDPHRKAPCLFDWLEEIHESSNGLSQQCLKQKIYTLSRN